MRGYAKLIAPDGVRSAEDRSGTIYHVNFDRHVEVPDDMVPALAAAGFTLAASTEKALDEFPTQADQWVRVDGKMFVRVFKAEENYADFNARLAALEAAFQEKQAAITQSIASMSETMASTMAATIAAMRFSKPVFDEAGNLIGAERVPSLTE